jgi:hypothetical protein
MTFIGRTPTMIEKRNLGFASSFLFKFRWSYEVDASKRGLTTSTLRKEYRLLDRRDSKESGSSSMKVIED